MPTLSKHDAYWHFIPDLSDSGGADFVLALGNNVRHGFEDDFAMVHPLEGVMIANIIPDPEEEVSKHYSRISFNKGTSWGPIAPPKQNLQGADPCADIAVRCPLSITAS